MKKSMKKVLLMALCGVMCVALFACAAPAAESGGISGKWVLTSVTTDDGTEATDEDLAAMESYYDFQSGGKLVVGALGQTVEGTWKVDGNSVTVEAPGSPAETGEMEGNTLTFQMNGATSVFTAE